MFKSTNVQFDKCSGQQIFGSANACLTNIHLVYIVGRRIFGSRIILSTSLRVDEFMGRRDRVAPFKRNKRLSLCIVHPNLSNPAAGVEAAHHRSLEKLSSFNRCDQMIL
jgi:hypothetical protein